ncbi:MAG: RagB/SusD family nutrient uptake outer membrane protein [Bacteroidales bacterium]|nr:RagB/SusD family nutrient uptake outer membrane protein [Bacteroidales bacterium]
MKLINIFSLLMLSLVFASCENLLEPEADNHYTEDRIYKDPTFASGFLLDAYIRLPTKSLSFNDVATDDAVTNDKINTFHRIATGQWSAIFNPLSQWDNCTSAILYINKFLEIIDTVPAWKWTDLELNSLYKQRFRGEAYALRGLFQYHLLVTIGGKGANGELLGIPIYDKFITTCDEFNTPRASFNESIDRIYADFDKALEYLTMDDYKDITTDAQLPLGLEGVKIANYNAVFGSRANQLISGRIVKAMKARVALLAASPAFADGDLVLWEKAANLAADVIKGIGGISGLDPNGHKYYDQTQVDKINLSKNIDQKEIIWREPIYQANSRESANFPPSLFGDGNVNPTQNLVDAFPMANGYPISNPASKYNPANPYAGRDPRLALYIVYNGSKMKGETIQTGLGGGINAKDSIQTSTRTGYYMRKLLREDVNMNPTASTTKNHYDVHMRYTELFLIYAEAANEAWGPDGMGANGFSARNIVAAIRKRAGITQPDNYLTSISTKVDMRELIHNERRIELCFEGFRFWDLRRWKANLNETANGVNIENTNFSYVTVEPRLYNNSYMLYGPIPHGEIIKFSSLVQNEGW